MKIRIWSYRALQKEPLQDAQKAQDHQTEFRSALEEKLLEKIVMIWTPAKTMKKTSQTNREEEATKRPPQKVQKAPGSSKWVSEPFGI